jgi:hypothetical protein
MWRIDSVPTFNGDPVSANPPLPDLSVKICQYLPGGVGLSQYLDRDVQRDSHLGRRATALHDERMGRWFCAHRTCDRVNEEDSKQRVKPCNFGGSRQRRSTGTATCSGPCWSAAHRKPEIYRPGHEEKLDRAEFPSVVRGYRDERCRPAVPVGVISATLSCQVGMVTAAHRAWGEGAGSAVRLRARKRSVRFSNWPGSDYHLVARSGPIPTTRLCLILPIGWEADLRSIWTPDSGGQGPRWRS